MSQIDASGTLWAANSTVKPQDVESAKTHAALILAALKAGERINPKIAADRWRCWRLAARIGELIDKGHVIESEKMPNSRFHEYWIK